jgi:hypothetical protein
LSWYYKRISIETSKVFKAFEVYVRHKNKICKSDFVSLLFVCKIVMLKKMFSIQFREKAESLELTAGDIGMQNIMSLRVIALWGVLISRSFLLVKLLF